MSNISDGVKMFVDQFRAQTDENLKRLGVGASESKLVVPRGIDLLTTGKTCLSRNLLSNSVIWPSGTKMCATISTASGWPADSCNSAPTR